MAEVSQKKTEFLALSVLEDICDQYVEELKLYLNNQRAICAMRGTSDRSMPRYSFVALSRKIFDQYDTSVIASLYISLFDSCDEYYKKKKTRTVGIRAELLTMDVSELVLNLMVPYQLPHTTKNADPHNPKLVKRSTINPRVRLTQEQSKDLLVRCLPIPVSPEFWKQIRFILMPEGSVRRCSQFAALIGEAAENGKISYGALVHCMQNDSLNRNLSPRCILQALYLGFLRASTVEFFASGRPAEFRKQCREFIFLAEIAKKDPIAFKKYCPPNIEKNPYLCNYRTFLTHATQLLDELRGVKKSIPPISYGWACAAIKKFGKRTYHDKTWPTENLFDLIWTVLVQRPSLKRFICETLEKEFQDIEAARFWRRMQPDQLDRIHIQNRLNTRIDPLFTSSEYLNFPPYVKGVQIISHPSQLSFLTSQIREEVVRAGKAIVGLDAEWTAFTGASKANILQVAVRSIIYIIDLDALSTQADLRHFFVDLFLDRKIVKLGFQFFEDLLQLRNAVSHCRALYEPENVLCVGKMVRSFIELSEKHPDCAEILNDVVPYFSLTPLDDTMESLPEELAAAAATDGSTINMEEKEREDLSDVHESMTGNDVDEVEGMGKADVDGGLETDRVREPLEPRKVTSPTNSDCPPDRLLNKGLSYFCEKILGRPLDKTEQCSVWDRRPLRPLQIRYAAMDAYCCIMLYDVCCKWAKRLGTDIETVVSNQSPIRVSLPLFSDGG
ncbi:unnamed protein product [Auanema sp. JU1783]|nr:unnamed protein product [Auanema sp. JU1783]